MNFSNLQIPISGLPAYEAVDFKPLETEYLQVQRIIFIITALIILALLATIFFFVEYLHEWYFILPAAIVFIILIMITWITTRLNFYNSGYAVREKDMVYRRGWFVQKTRVVPLNRVQHVSVQSGPLERKYKLASVSIFTAGAEQADFTIHGITQDTAHQIKDWITAQLHGNITQPA